MSPIVPVCAIRKYRRCSGNRHDSEYVLPMLHSSIPVVPICVQRFHRHYSGQPALLYRRLRTTTAVLMKCSKRQKYKNIGASGLDCQLCAAVRTSSRLAAWVRVVDCCKLQVQRSWCSVQGTKGAWNTWYAIDGQGGCELLVACFSRAAERGTISQYCRLLY